MDTTVSTNDNTSKTPEPDPLKVVGEFPTQCVFTCRRTSDVVKDRSSKTYGTNCHLVVEMEGKFPYPNQAHNAPFSMTTQDDDALAMRVRAHTNGLPVSVDIRASWGSFHVAITWFVRASGPSKIKLHEIAWGEVMGAVERPYGTSLDDLCGVLIRDLFHTKARAFRDVYVKDQADDIINTLAEVCDKRAREAVGYSEKLSALNAELAAARLGQVDRVLKKAAVKMVDNNLDRDIISAVLKGLPIKVGSGQKALRILPVLHNAESALETALKTALEPVPEPVPEPTVDPYNPENIRVGDRVMQTFGDEKTYVGTVTKVGPSDESQSDDNVYVTIKWDDGADDEVSDAREVEVVWRGDGSLQA